MMNNSTSPANSPTPNTQEETTSAPLEKLPKLNLPPKPILATAATPPTTTPPLGTPPPAPVVANPTAVPPPLGTAPVTTVITPTKKPEPPEISTVNKKRAFLSMPLALTVFLVALLGLIVQLFTFLHLF